MEIQSSRLTARVGPDGEPVLLLDQERRKWDRLNIRRGLAALDRADRLSDAPGPYALQAAIAACHARAVRAERTDWARIVELYALLAVAMPSAVVELNRAVAVSMLSGPNEGLALVDHLRADGALDGYHLLHSVRGHLLSQLQRHAEAQEEFELAASLAANAQERTLSAERAAASAAASAGDTSTPTRRSFEPGAMSAEGSGPSPG